MVNKMFRSLVFRFVVVFVMGVIVLSPSWSQTSPSVFGDSSIYDITWGNGKFVAVGGNGKIAFSSNGVNWTLVKNSSFGESAIGGITFGNGKFVAVGDEGKIVVSQDGIVWTSVKNTTFGDSGINDIAFGNGLFVAVGDDNKIAVSQDGSIWNSEIKSPFNNDANINNIVFGNGKFVISRWGRGKDAIAVSTDAKNWILSGTSYEYGFAFIYDIAFGNGQFIAVGNTGADSGFLYTSYDGLTWYEKESSFHPQAGDILTAAYGNGRFIATGTNGSLAISDNKAEKWVLLVSNASYAAKPRSRDTLFSIIYANGKFVGVGEKGKIATSPDGINWTDIRTGVGDFFYGDFHYTESDGEITILSYRGKSENVSIPAVINGKPIVELGEKAFNDNYALNSVTIPESVKTIGYMAFVGYHLTSVTIGANVKLYYSFSSCGFEEAYTANSNQAGTYTRPNDNSKTWTRK